MDLAQLLFENGGLFAFAGAVLWEVRLTRKALEAIVPRMAVIESKLGIRQATAPVEAPATV